MTKKKPYTQCLPYTKDNLTLHSSNHATDSSEWTTHSWSEKLGNFSVDRLRFGCRGPPLDNLTIFIDQKLFKVPLRPKLQVNTPLPLRPMAKSRHTLIMEIPRSPDFWPLSHLYTSLVPDPLTSDFFMSGNVTPAAIAALNRSPVGTNAVGLPKFFVQKVATSSSVPASPPPNWLQGKPKMSKPWSLYFW